MRNMKDMILFIALVFLAFIFAYGIGISTKEEARAIELVRIQQLEIVSRLDYISEQLKIFEGAQDETY